MRIEDIKSDKVRAILTGDPTPAWTLRDMAADLSVADFREACSYFGGYSRLVEQAVSERNFCFERDI